jgi:hypothetical protein
VDIEDLPVPFQLPQDRIPDQIVGITRHHGLDCLTVHRRSIDNGKVTDSKHGEMQGAGDRGCGEGHDIHTGPILLEPLLVLDPEALFLIYD